jgi:hypothetical protein
MKKRIHCSFPNDFMTTNELGSGGVAMVSFV